MSQRGEVIEQILKTANQNKLRDAGEFVLDVLDGLINPAKRPASKYNPKIYTRSVFARLLDKKWLKLEQRGTRKIVRLTARGKEELAKYMLGEIKIKKPWRWDHKWRVLIFDIKEFKRSRRNKLRHELLKLGFMRLQNSVFVHPYECEEVMVMLKSYFQLGGEVLYMTVEKIENDRWLREEFELIN